MTKSPSTITNNKKPNVPTSNHQFGDQWPIILLTSGAHVAHKTGNSQLKPIAPRTPAAIFVLFDPLLLLGPNSDCTTNVIAIKVDDPSSNRAVNAEHIKLYHSWNKFKKEKKLIKFEFITSYNFDVLLMIFYI